MAGAETVPTGKGRGMNFLTILTRFVCFVLIKLSLIVCVVVVTSWLPLSQTQTGFRHSDFSLFTVNSGLINFIC